MLHFLCLTRVWSLRSSCFTSFPAYAYTTCRATCHLYSQFLEHWYYAARDSLESCALKLGLRVFCCFLSLSSSSSFVPYTPLLHFTPCPLALPSSLYLYFSFSPSSLNLVSLSFSLSLIRYAIFPSCSSSLILVVDASFAYQASTLAYYIPKKKK